MVSDHTQSVTVDRISNGGNPIAKETHGGKTIHVPSGLEGETYEVRLRDKGGYIEAHLVHQQDGLRSSGPATPSSPSSSNESLIELGKELMAGETLTIEQRECSDNRLGPAEYPGKEHRKTIASRYD